MKPGIILHVGTEKTGSTSIQSLLSTSYDSLIKSGILFPKSIGHPCHINLTACALESEPKHPIRALLGLQDQTIFIKFVEETKNALRKEIEENHPTALIISDEHINVHLSKIETIHAYKKICEEFGDIKAVVIYLRQQDEFRLSLFSEAVKAGNLSNFNLLDPLPVFKTIPYRLNYLKILDNLSKVFDKKMIIPRVYDRALFPNADICSDFLNILHIPLDYKTIIKSENNLSVDGKIIKKLALISSFLKGLKNKPALKLQQFIIRHCIKKFTGSGIVLKKEAHERYLAQFNEKNELVKEKYFTTHQIEKNLFPDKYSHSKKPVYPDCTISWFQFFIKFFF